MTKLQVFGGEPGTVRVHSARCRQQVGKPGEIEAGDALGVVMGVWGEVTLDTIEGTLFYPCVKFGLPEGSRPRRDLWFDPDDYDDDALIEIIKQCSMIKWWNDLGQRVEEARLYPGEGNHPDSKTPYHNQTYMTMSSEGRRILTFVEDGATGGFRSCRIDDLIWAS